MYILPTKANIFLYEGTINICFSFQSICRLIHIKFKRPPQEGEIYIFFNKNRDKIKVYFETTKGPVILYKKLAGGLFEIKDHGSYKKITGINPIKLLEDLRIREKRN